MKTRILLFAAVALLLITIASGPGTALADGGKGKISKSRAPTTTERVVERVPVFSPQGRVLGILTTVVGSTDAVQAGGRRNLHIGGLSSLRYQK